METLASRSIFNFYESGVTAPPLHVYFECNLERQQNKEKTIVHNSNKSVPDFTIIAIGRAAAGLKAWILTSRKVFSEESQWKSEPSYWLLKNEDNGSGKMAAHVGCVSVSGVVTDVQ
ncbi:UNVERIFIED_CONTAM: hypothetical protein NCL1_35972 [Trichonephila clavipes]